MRMWIIDNLAIKIGALFIALFLWFHAVTEKEFEIRRRVPIQVSAVPGDLILARPIPNEAVIRLKGKGKQLIIPFFSQIELLADASGVERGPTQITLTPENVDIPQGGGAILVEIISPRKVDLEFDLLLERKVPVKSKITVKPFEAFVQVGSVSFDPDSVMVGGPSQYVQPIEFVFTDTVRYSGAKKPLVDVVNLITPEGFNVTIDPKKIEASSDIQRLVQRTIADIPVTLTHIPNGMSVYLEPSVISITITGGEEYLASLQKDNFSVYADYRRAQRTSDNRISARINLPPEVELTGAKPQTFRVVTEG
jgi:YbbR domain-containing protein